MVTCTCVVFRDDLVESKIKFQALREKFEGGASNLEAQKSKKNTVSKLDAGHQHRNLVHNRVATLRLAPGASSSKQQDHVPQTQKFKQNSVGASLRSEGRVDCKLRNEPQMTKFKQNSVEAEMNYAPGSSPVCKPSTLNRSIGRKKQGYALNPNKLDVRF